VEDKIARYRKYLVITALIYSAILVSVGLIMNSVGESDCNLLSTRLSEIGDTLSEFGNKLSIYEARHLTKSPEYYYLKPYYFLTEIKAYLLMRKLQRDCNTDYSLILFFYKQGDDDSRQQGFVLDDIVRKMPGRVHVFSFDVNFPVDVGAVDLLKEYYDVNTAPVVIVNDRNRFVGLTPEWKILAAIKQS